MRNLADGRVEVQLEGPAATLETAEARLREGPRSARVDRAESRESPLEGCPGFEILWGG